METSKKSSGTSIQTPGNTGGGSGGSSTQTVTKILFESYSSQTQARTLFTMDLDGSNITPLDILGHTFIAGSEPSPNGEYIAFTSNKENGMQIWVWNKKINQTTRLTNFAATDKFSCVISSLDPNNIDHCLSWSPDSTKITFSVGLTPDRKIYAVDIHQPLIPTQVNQYSYDNTEPFFAPNNQRIIYVGMYENRTKSFLFSLNEQNQNQQYTSSATDYFENPSWAPQGDKIAFIKRLAGSNDKKAMWDDLNTGVITPLDDNPGAPQTRTGFVDRVPAWSPNGQKILFLSTETSTRRNYIHYYDIQSLRLSSVVNSTIEQYGDLCWLNDDKIIYTSNKFGGAHLFSATLAMPQPKQLTTVNQNLHPTLFRYTP
ncbi:MAG: PD40 domain-containing protein [Deltaproteobacteria bacterium]|nr:PD40 domain-containing protein [Deltaproteobacteria bacterium]